MAQAGLSPSFLEWLSRNSTTSTTKERVAVCTWESPGHMPLLSKLCCSLGGCANRLELGNRCFSLQETIQPQRLGTFLSALAQADPIMVNIFPEMPMHWRVPQPHPGLLTHLWCTLTRQDPHQALQGQLCCCFLLLLCPGWFRHGWQNSSGPDGFLQQLEVLDPALGAGQVHHLDLQPPVGTGQEREIRNVRLVPTKELSAEVL